MIVSKEAFFSLALDPELFSVSLRLIAYVFKFAPPENPMLIGSCKKIAKYLDCSTSSVTKAMKKFEEMGYVSKVQNGVWNVEYETISAISQTAHKELYGD